VCSEVVRAETTEVAQRALDHCRRAEARGLISRGLGRSYGDAAQLAHGVVLDMTPLNSFRLNAAEQTVTAQAGTTIGQLLSALMPAGWVVPVVPGTQHVTVGGAIASDIHGKNHRHAGTFGSHVQAIGLMTASGEVLELERDGPGEELLRATIGGMGLTGAILWARIALFSIGSGLLSVDTDRVDSIDAALNVLAAPGGPYRVAWLDLLSSRLARGVVTRAEHLAAAAAAEPSRGQSVASVASRARVPARWPGGILRASTVRAYNEFRYRSTPRRQRGHAEGYAAHMFPLDVLEAWPRLYGRHGFVQYQLVVPVGAEPALEAVIQRLRRSRVPCFLAVLKDMGDANDAPLSFPLAGWTLTLDLPRSADGLANLLNAFDEIVAGAGGRVYLSKDARLSQRMLEVMYPRLAQWREIRDGADPDRCWRSDLAIRTGLLGGERG